MLVFLKVLSMYKMLWPFEKKNACKVCFHEILRGKDDHESIFLVKDFGGCATRKRKKEEKMEGRAI